MYPSVALSQTLRITRRLLAQALLVCLSAAAADAATHTQRHGVARRHASALSSSAVVHAQTSPSCGTGLTLRTLQRQSRTVAGPVARTSRVARALQRGLPLPKPLLKRGTAPPSGDDDDAIANDAPAASIDDENGGPSLRPLGFLDSSFHCLLPSSPVALFASRGPPPVA